MLQSEVPISCRSATICAGLNPNSDRQRGVLPFRGYNFTGASRESKHAGFGSDADIRRVG